MVRSRWRRVFERLTSTRKSARRPIRTRLGIESLEAREVPATFINATTLTYQDVDGDDVTVKFSKGILNAGNVNSIFTFNTGSVNGSNATRQMLRLIDLSGTPGAAGTTVATTAVRSLLHGGDGFATLGELRAAGLDLGAVNIDGDLGRVMAGDASTSTAGLNGLTVQSLGRYGTSTGALSLHSTIQGRLAFLTVKSDVKDVFIEVQGNTDGDIGTITIYGSLIGGAADNSGRIVAQGDMGTATIKGDIIGGAGADSGELNGINSMAGTIVGGSILGGIGVNSGRINGGANIGPIGVAHDVVGGAGADSGEIFAGGRIASITIGGSLENGGIKTGRIFANSDIGTLKVIGNVVGATDSSGSILAGGKIGSVTIGGSLIGGGNSAGRVFAGGEITTLTIAGNLVGGSAGGNQSLSQSGYVEAKRIATLTVGGSVIAGVNNSSGLFLNNGAIRVNNDIGSATIKGSLIGNSTNPVIISARGQAAPPATADVAIGRLNVLGRVEYARIVAGWTPQSVVQNADAQIGTVIVGGDWIASNLAAGAVPGIDGYFGNNDDQKISGNFVKDSATVNSRIASITIAGQALGTDGGNDCFGFVAQEIGTVRIGGTTFATKAGAGNDDFAVSWEGDVKVNEVA